jgi:hypothetical protein
MTKQLHDESGYAFSTIHTDLNRSFRVGKSADLAAPQSQEFGDLREQLAPWEERQAILPTVTPFRQR